MLLQPSPACKGLPVWPRTLPTPATALLASLGRPVIAHCQPAPVLPVSMAPPVLMGATQTHSHAHVWQGTRVTRVASTLMIVRATASVGMEHSV